MNPTRAETSHSGGLELIGIDADDTLWHTESLYRSAQERFKRLLAPYNDMEVIERNMHATEIRNLEAYGYGFKGFILSLLESAIELSAGRIRGDEIQQILELAKEMSSPELLPIEGAEDSLRQLAARYRLALITKGDSSEQEAKIRRSGLGNFFQQVEVVSDKTSSSYARILELSRVNPSRFLMVGNSLRSDILPVLALGGQAIYIPHPLTWTHETVQIPDKQRQGYYELEHIGLLPELVAKLDGNLDRPGETRPD